VSESRIFDERCYSPPPVTDATDLPEAARAFADGDVDLLPSALEERAVAALVALLIARGDAARLERLAASPDKALAKPARRGLHVLRTRGVAAPKAEPRAFRIERGPYVDEVPSVATHVDGRGERVVFLARPAPDGGLHVFQARLSEERGLVDFAAGAMSRKDWRAHERGVLDDPALVAAAVPTAHARWLVERAYEQTVALGRAAPRGFAEARLSLGPVVAPAQHPAVAFALDEDRAGLAALHEDRATADWIPPLELLRELDHELGKISESRLIVDPAARLEQLDAAIGRLADAALASPFRARLVERLRETAYLYALRDHADRARRFAAAAALTADDTVAGADNPFVRRLFDKLVDRHALLNPDSKK
jgi:hypothetical protein